MYFLSGEENYYIDKISDFIAKNVLTENEKSFNQTVFYGKDSEVASVINASKRFPMMSNYQVIILKEGQELKDFDELIHYIEKPLNSTILVINYKYKNPDNRKKVFKSLRQYAVFFESKKVYDDKIPMWISDLLKEKNYKIEPKAAMLLTEFIGNDLSRIENEIEKLIITIPENIKIITADHVERNIGISKDYNVFELQKALTRNDVVKANRIINYFAQNPKNHPFAFTIINLFNYFSKVMTYHYLNGKSDREVAAILKIHPYFVSDYANASRVFNKGRLVHLISLLREYDVKSKGVGNVSTSEGQLLKELIYKIIH